MKCLLSHSLPSKRRQAEEVRPRPHVEGAHPRRPRTPKPYLLVELGVEDAALGRCALRAVEGRVGVGQQVIALAAACAEGDAGAQREVGHLGEAALERAVDQADPVDELGLGRGGAVACDDHELRSGRSRS